MLQFLKKSRTDPLQAATISKTEYPTIPREMYNWPASSFYGTGEISI